MNNIQQIGETFSAGDFKSVYEHFADSIQWTIIGDRTTLGKADTIAFCDKMLVEMAGSQLTNTNTIASSDQVAVEGYCRYTDADDKTMQVQYRDIYKFGNRKIESITSYCITSPVL